MINKTSIVLVCIMFCSCKTHLDSNRHNDDNNPKKVYRLRLNPPEGAKYVYTVTRSTEFEVEMEGKKIDNKNKANFEVSYKGQGTGFE